jgi:hypothetical protein
MHSHTNAPATHKPDSTVIFFPLLTLTLVMWVIYRSLFTFPVWFDETVGKAIFFGVPVWLYVTVTRSRTVLDSFASHKVKHGLLLGLAIGGIFGFVGSILSLISKSSGVEAVMLFNSTQFWREFMLAMLTAFWETLLFFSFVMAALEKKYGDWSVWQVIVLTSVIFVLFHIPNTFLRFATPQVSAQLSLLALFAVGQASLFAATRNGYALVLSHAIWGMVLLIHSW